MDSHEVLCSGVAERIGLPMGMLTHKIAPDSDHAEKIVKVQKMALKGYLPGWEAALEEPASAQDRALWHRLSGVEIPASLITRKDILQYLYTYEP